MKAIATSLLLFISVSIHAQYQSIFGQNSTEWSELFSNLGFTITNNCSISGDTTIAGMNYKKVNSSVAMNIFLREDTATGKVWAAFFDLGFQESLVADYSLVPGDTFYIQRLPGPYIDTAIVDSVYIMSGKKHIVFNYGLPWYSGIHRLVFIEGTGSTFGLLFTFAYNLSPVMLCKSKDNVQEYANTLFNGSCTITGIESSTVQNGILLERQGDCYVVRTEGDREPMQINVTDMHGRVIKAEFVAAGTGEAFINLTDLSNGMYIISVHTNNIHQTTKILK
jgi:hypothetical protein